LKLISILGSVTIVAKRKYMSNLAIIGINKLNGIKKTPITASLNIKPISLDWFLS